VAYTLSVTAAVPTCSACLVTGSTGHVNTQREPLQRATASTLPLASASVSAWMSLPAAAWGAAPAFVTASDASGMVPLAAESVTCPTSCAAPPTRIDPEAWGPGEARTRFPAQAGVVTRAVITGFVPVTPSRSVKVTR
jgi:hypothetical protein